MVACCSWYQIIDCNVGDVLTCAAGTCYNSEIQDQEAGSLLGQGHSDG